MGWIDADGYTLAREILQRGVAGIYMLAFANVIAQWRPLLGERGLSPVGEVLRERPSLASPSLFHARYSDRLATTLAWVGVAVAASLVAGVPQAGPAWAPLAAFGVLWVLYLSYVTVGRIWYAFGWETLLLEAGVVVAFLGPADQAPTWPALLLVRWLLVRVELGAGLIKWRGDPCWRQLTCLDVHHETQPLPGPLSRRFHLLPRRSHRIETGTNHVVQLVLPFGLMLPQPVAGVCATAMIVTQGWLVISGNFAWLNALTLILAFSAIPDVWLRGLAGLLGASQTPPADLATSPVWFLVVVGLFTVLVVWLSVRGPIPNLLSRRQAMNAGHGPLRLVNSYGAFGSVTRTRFELEIEGSWEDRPRLDAPADAGAHAGWHAFGFRAKPGDPARRPPQIAPWHLRLDWLLWFAAMDPVPTRHVWFARLLDHLLAGDPLIRRLIRHDPGAGDPPSAVRVVRWRYRYTDAAERRATGDWWVRDRPEVVVPPTGQSSRGAARGTPGR